MNFEYLNGIVDYCINNHLPTDVYLYGTIKELEEKLLFVKNISPTGIEYGNNVDDDQYYASIVYRGYKFYLINVERN